MTSSAPVATVLITSKNRRDRLRAAIQSVYSQEAAFELIVIDDGSIDGTSEMVRSEFPSAILMRNEQSLGIIAARNRAIALAKASILFTLDDDAVYTAPNTLSVVLKCFEHPRVGAVAIPYLNYVNGNEVGTSNVVPWANESDFPCITAFSGGACAFSVELFRACGGYSGVGRQHEEVSLCLQLLAKGYVVRVASVPPIAHYPNHITSMHREILKETIKNRLAFAWEQVPWPYMPILACGAAARYIVLGARKGALGAALLGVGEGILGMTKSRRQSVSTSAYRLHRRLGKKGPLRLSEIEPSLPPIAATEPRQIRQASTALTSCT